MHKQLRMSDGPRVHGAGRRDHRVMHEAEVGTPAALGARMVPEQTYRAWFKRRERLDAERVAEMRRRLVLVRRALRVT